MASKGNERRGLSPSNPPHTVSPQHKKSPSPSPSSAGTGLSNRKNLPNSVEKNALKPTRNSRVDPSATGKKQVSTTTSTSQKALLQRRSSFDKPPSPSTPHRSVLSSSSSHGARSHQSSSASPRTTIAPKPHMEKIPRATKELGKSHSMYSRPTSVKKAVYVVKKDNNPPPSATSTIKAPTIGVDATNALSGFESKQEDHEFSIAEVEEEILKVESNDELLSDISIPDDENLLEHSEAELVNHEDEELKAHEVHNVVEDQSPVVAPQVEEVSHEEVHVEETNDDHEENEESQNIEVPEKVHQEESLEVEPNVEGEDKEGEEVANEVSKGKESEENEEVENAKEIEEHENRSGGGEEVKKPAVVESNEIVKHSLPLGKKESPGYNDVIEETASKLLEKRKNKVRALVGAFETVISLQEPDT